MGVLTDFVVANRNDAQRVCDSSCPSDDFGGMDGKGLDAVKLSSLYAILTGGKFDPTFISDSLCDAGEDGPWVFEVPSVLVQLLAGLSPQQLTEVGQKWAAIDVFSPKYDNWPTERVHEALVDLVVLCQQAARDGKAVLMWMCL